MLILVNNISWFSFDDFQDTPLFTFLSSLLLVDGLIWSFWSKNCNNYNNLENWQKKTFQSLCLSVSFTLLKGAWGMAHTQGKPWVFQTIRVISSEEKASEKKKCRSAAQKCGKWWWFYQLPSENIAFPVKWVYVHRPVRAGVHKYKWRKLVVEEK